MKGCLSMQSIENDSEQDTHLQRCQEPRGSKQILDSGVKKLFILGIAQSCQENYENASSLWSAIDINKFDGTVSTDLKLANILIGIMGHSSMSPCTWYIAEKGKLNEKSTLRTIGNISKSYSEWHLAGSEKKGAKNYNN